VGAVVAAAVAAVAAVVAALLALLVAIVLSLFVACCSFRRTMLTWHQRAMVGFCVRFSAALFVIACRPAIVNDFDARCWPTAHLVALM